MSEKTEKPSQYKLKKAQQKGQVLKLPSLNIIVFLITSLITLCLTDNPIRETFTFFIYSSSHVSVTEHNLDIILNSTFYPLAQYFFELLLPPILMLVLFNLVLNKGVWSPQILNPKLERIHPKSGLKKILSKENLFDAFKISLIYVGSTLILVFWFNQYAPNLLRISLFNQQLSSMLNALLVLIFYLIAYFSCVAILDGFIKHKKYLNSQKMSKQELKDEYKEREGDPKVKSKRKGLYLKLKTYTQSLAQVKNADVILTNPTHYAIAFQYIPKKMIAPIIIAKGQGLQAQLIKKIARHHQIIMIENKALAQKIFQLSTLNHPVNAEFYPMLADIYQQVFQLRRVSHE